MTHSETTFTRGQVARQFKMSLHTLMHYENVGLLHPLRIEGQRAYRDVDLRVLAIILAQRRLGLTLSEIKARLAAEPPSDEAAKDVPDAGDPEPK